MTQVRWAIRDFVHRFGRAPEGLWLPETAVDLETLQVLADHDIRFTILAPHQARRVQADSTDEWRDVSGGSIDPTTAYLCRLPGGRTIAVFYYDAAVARAVAFEGILEGGERFLQRLLGSFRDDRPWPQLVHIATDGESYGHHHRLGEMALAYVLLAAPDQGAALTVYGQFLEQHPAGHEVEIAEATSWSCVHGVERWRSECGCNSGRYPGWHQRWRAPLREALDWLRDGLALLYETQAGDMLRDPWAARDDYIDVLLDRAGRGAEPFFARHGARALTQTEQARALGLLEMQRQAMLMYASDGWFFDDISGIETVQVLRHAGRAVDLAAQIAGATLEPELVRRLAAAPSNVPAAGDGGRVYAAAVHLQRHGAQ